ncbi:MAG: cell division protein FtsK, partial [Chloroflexaceae bacterium]
MLNHDQQPEPRLWERRPWDNDFLELRLGIGSTVPGFTVRAPTPPRDAAPDRRIYALQQQYATLTGVPVSVPVARLGSLGLAGPQEARDALLRALIWQVVTLHAPNEVRLAFVGPPEHIEEWAWLRWLDHTIPLSNEPGQRLRMVASEPRSITTMLSTLLDEFSRRRDRTTQARAKREPLPIFPTILLIVIGSKQLQSQPLLVEVMRAGAAYQMLLVCVEDRWEELPGDCAAMVDVNAAGEVRIALAGAAWSTERCIADVATLELSDKLARCLAGIRLIQDGARQELPRNRS